MQFSLGSYGCKRELSCMSDGDMWGRGSKAVSSLYTPSFLAPILSLRSYYICKLQAKFLASQDSFHMVWGLRWDWEVCLSLIHI